MKRTGFDRRAFVGLLGAAAAALAVRQIVAPKPDDEDRPRDTWTGSTRWIGHC